MGACSSAGRRTGSDIAHSAECRKLGNGGSPATASTRSSRSGWPAPRARASAASRPLWTSVRWTCCPSGGRVATFPILPATRRYVSRVGITHESAKRTLPLSQIMLCVADLQKYADEKGTPASVSFGLFLGKIRLRRRYPSHRSSGGAAYRPHRSELGGRVPVSAAGRTERIGAGCLDCYHRCDLWPSDSRCRSATRE